MRERELERKASWAVPAAIVGLIVALAIGALAFALDRVESEAEREASEPAPVITRPVPAPDR